MFLLTCLFYVQRKFKVKYMSYRHLLFPENKSTLCISISNTYKHVCKFMQNFSYDRLHIIKNTNTQD